MANDIRQRFIDAKAHIDAGQYAQARALLESIEHPTATQWLDQLDKLEARTRPIFAQPDDPDPAPAPPPRRAQPAPPSTPANAPAMGRPLAEPQPADQEEAAPTGDAIPVRLLAIVFGVVVGVTVLAGGIFAGVSALLDREPAATATPALTPTPTAIPTIFDYENLYRTNVRGGGRIEVPYPVDWDAQSRVFGDNNTIQVDNVPNSIDLDQPEYNVDNLTVLLWAIPYAQIGNAGTRDAQELLLRTTLDLPGQAWQEQTRIELRNGRGAQTRNGDNSLLYLFVEAENAIIGAIGFSAPGAIEAQTRRIHEIVGQAAYQPPAEQP